MCERRYLFDRILSENQEFLLLVYSSPHCGPEFYKCSAAEFDRLSYDFAGAEVSYVFLITVKKIAARVKQVMLPLSS